MTCSPASAQKVRAERPTYVVGDKWIRSDGVFDLVRIEKDIYIFVAEGRREIHLTKDLAVAKVVRGGQVEVEFDPPASIGWPLEVGKWGSSTSLVRSATDARPGFRAGGVGTLTWEVQGYDTITTPAGTYSAFRIFLRLSGPAVGGPVMTIWYAPEARQVVRARAGGGVQSLVWDVVALERQEAAPLQLALAGPDDQAHVQSDRLPLTGKVTAGRGVSRVVVTVNGDAVAQRDETRAPKPEIALDVPVKLREGKNVVLVTATDTTGQTRQESRTVFLEREAPVVAAPPAPAVGAPAPPGGSTAAVPAPVAPPAAPAPPAIAPLQVVFSSPRDQARVEQESVALAGLASSGKGIRRVVVTLNGVEMGKREESAPQPSVAVNLPLKLQEGQNTVVLTATDASGLTQQEVRTVHYEKSVPLRVTFRYPEDRAKLTDESSVVAAAVASSRGIAKVTVSVNGAEVHQQAERTPRKSLVVSVPVKLREGANAIVVSASEPDGTQTQEVHTVIYERPVLAAAPAPALAAPPAKPASDRWAVVIGVGRYESREVPPLAYAVADAEALYQMLIGPGGFKKEHVLLLTDRTERKPTLRNIKWALGTFLTRSAKKDDTVLVFFAGHGAPEVDPRGLERDGLAKYLAPADVEPDDLYSTALPMDELQNIFARIEAEKMVVFLDACYSGAAPGGGRTFASKKTRAAHVDDLFLERLARSKGRAIVTASRPAEVSLEVPELGHGLFTYYLLLGLKGGADLNRDGIVSLQELYEYLEQQVTQKSRALGGNQHPVMKGELEGVLPLMKVGAR
jgi:uncharacterized caspase-like protein